MTTTNPSKPRAESETGGDSCAIARGNYGGREGVWNDAAEDTQQGGDTHGQRGKAPGGDKLKRSREGTQGVQERDEVNDTMTEEPVESKPSKKVRRNHSTETNTSVPSIAKQDQVILKLQRTPIPRASTNSKTLRMQLSGSAVDRSAYDDIIQRLGAIPPIPMKETDPIPETMTLENLPLAKSLGEEIFYWDGERRMWATIINIVQAKRRRKSNKYSSQAAFALNLLKHVICTLHFAREYVGCGADDLLFKLPGTKQLIALLGRDVDLAREIQKENGRYLSQFVGAAMSTAATRISLDNETNVIGFTRRSFFETFANTYQDGVDLHHIYNNMKVDTNPTSRWALTLFETQMRVLEEEFANGTELGSKNMVTSLKTALTDVVVKREIGDIVDPTKIRLPLYRRVSST